MCGIAGVVRFDGGIVDPALLAAMADQLVHRGPDGHGVWVDGSVGFAHRRLSIIDLAGSPQPMSSSDAAGRLHVTFNGEILNYQELRHRTPYDYQTNGDTEVLLALYAAHGPESVTMLRGQFAYAMHDARDGSVTLFRDRLGILPLYYWADERSLAFASEIKALLPALPAAPAVDEQGLAAYLAHRSVPSPDTLFEGVKKLPPGHRLRVTRDGDRVVERWWSIPPVDTTQDVAPTTAVQLVREALDASVERNLVADVPVGAYLSGGVDSSLIVALMTARAGGDRVHTFSAGFGDAELDEVAHARHVSEHLGTVHHEVTVTPDDFERLWGRLTWHRDAPISEPADVAVFRLAELARREVKVVLSGEGSDELFAGYPKYHFARATSWAGVVPYAVRGPLLDAVQRHLPASLGRARIAVRAMAARDEAARLEAWFAPFTAEERARLLAVPRQPGAAIPVAEGDAVRKMLYADCHAWLADNLLERGDRMSMAASLELRPPFLDHELVELAFTLPSNVKLRDGRRKWVVKEVARELLPAHIVDRRKAGFRVPLASWFRGSLRDLARDRLLDPMSFVGQVFDRREVRALLESHEGGRRNEEMRIWTLLCLEVWYEQFRGQLAGQTTNLTTRDTAVGPGR
jgi:asparagine synthase (glutamine-hydrolysing)